MKPVSNKVLAVLLSMSLAGMSLPAFAYNGQNQNGPHQNEQRQSQSQQHKPQGGPHAAPQQVKKVAVVKPHQAWKVGNSLPASYRAKTYRVADYRTHHLKQPGKNQHWYKVNGDYVLVNVITNSILQIITGS